MRSGIYTIDVALQLSAEKIIVGRVDVLTSSILGKAVRKERKRQQWAESKRRQRAANRQTLMSHDYPQHDARMLAHSERMNTTPTMAEESAQIEDMVDKIAELINYGNKSEVCRLFVDRNELPE